MTVPAVPERLAILALATGDGPAGPGSLDPVVVPATSEERASEGHVGRSARLLIVDDEPLIREAFGDLLTARGFTVVGVAADGAEAVDAVRELKPDLVLMDVRMPSVDGIEASRRIKRARPRTRIILLSAYEDPSLRREGEEAGVHAYLIKGTPPEVIERVIMAALS